MYSSRVGIGNTLCKLYGHELISRSPSDRIDVQQLESQLLQDRLKMRKVYTSEADTLVYQEDATSIGLEN